jgi:hypothetical protein
MENGTENYEIHVKNFKVSECNSKILNILYLYDCYTFIIIIIISVIFVVFKQKQLLPF